MGYKDRISGWTIAGFILTIFSIFFIVFASAYPYWQESREERNTGITNIGFWEICFDERGFSAPVHARDDLMKRYYGCTYVFDRELRKIVQWIFPGWYIVTVTFVTLGLLVQPIAVILVIVYMARVCSPHSEHILIGVAFLLNAVIGILTMISIVLFGLKAGEDEDWMPQPESNFLSYSYGVCAFVPVISFFSAMSFAVDYLRLDIQRRINARAKVYARGEFNGSRF